MADTAITFSFGAKDLAAGALSEDRALVRRLCAAEEAAYEELLRRFEHPIYNLVCRLTDHPEDGADVTQEVFLKVFRGIGSFRGRSSLKTWIYRIAVNEARNHRRSFLRHRKQEVRLEPEGGDSMGCADWVADPSPSPYEIVLDHEAEQLIERTLAELNPNFRAALVLRDIEGMPYEEISEILEISLGTVKSRILRGREALKERLTAHLEPSPQPFARGEGLVAR
ncbi:MAG TPA: sigma-70 family RNA polymerase sigma factor [Bryobacteraceae bacterium]|nr:sigma-70 family RNA polymerase sigma factor [Bryobacteraceae bacterium]